MIELVGSRKEQLEIINPSKPVDTQYFYDEGYKAGVDSVIDFAVYAENISNINRHLITHKEVIINLPHATNLNALFNLRTADKVNQYVEHITVNCPNPITAVSSMFYSTAEDSVLKHITLNIDMSKATNTVNMFRFCDALEVIDGNPLDFSSVASMNIFNGCKNVREVRFAEGSIKLNFTCSYSPYLSDETIESLIAGLADLTGETAQTLTLHKTVGNKLTDAQKEAIKNKNWTLTY